MKLNGFEMELSSYSSEKLNDELVLYVEERKVRCRFQYEIQLFARKTLSLLLKH